MTLVGQDANARYFFSAISVILGSLLRGFCRGFANDEFSARQGLTKEGEPSRKEGI